MIESEAFLILGSLAGAWLAGWLIGFIFKTVKQFSEKI